MTGIIDTFDTIQALKSIINFIFAALWHYPNFQNQPTLLAMS